MSVTRSAIFGSAAFRRSARHEDLIIHQLKYPHDDADVDINVIFPIERLQELAAARGARRTDGEFLQLHRLQHGSGEIRADRCPATSPTR